MYLVSAGRPQYGTSKYIPKKKIARVRVCACARVRVCSTNLGFSGETLILVLVGKTLILFLVWGTYYVPATYVPGTCYQPADHSMVPGTYVSVELQLSCCRNISRVGASR